MLAAFDIYINYIKDPKDDELVGMKFLKANIYRRYNHFDEAIPIFEDILEHHRSTRPREYSANLLLDTYNRLQKYDEMLALVDKLDGDPKFLEGKDDLKATLDKLKAQSMRKKAEKLETDAKESEDFAQVRRVRPGATSTSTTATRRRRRTTRSSTTPASASRRASRSARRSSMFNLLAEVLPELARSPRRRSRGSARRTATSRSTTARRRSSRSTRRSTPARRTRTTR